MSVASLFMLGCERHQFEDTKVLHGDHGHHGEGHGDSHETGHGDGHENGHGAKAHEDAKGHGDEAHDKEKPHSKQPGKVKKEEPRDVGL